MFRVAARKAVLCLGRLITRTVDARKGVAPVPGEWQVRIGDLMIPMTTDIRKDVAADSQQITAILRTCAG